MTPRILLVDGSNITMRAAFGGDVDVERAIPVATGMLDRAVRELHPTHAILCLDPFWSQTPTWRRQEYPAYKANRTMDTTPFLLRAASEWERAGWFTVGVEEFEADDVIATLAHRLQARAEIVILSNDSDLLQLARQGVTIARPKAGGFDVLNAGSVAAKYGVPASKLADFKALAGEPGDNVPGPFGKKCEATARKVLARYQTLEEAIAAGEKRDAPKELRKLYENREVARQALRLVTLRTDAPVPAIQPAKCRLAAEEARGAA